MAVGLGTGSTVAELLPVLAERHLDVRYFATSLGTRDAALALGLEVDEFASQSGLDLAIDGADQVGADRWLVKGGGGAHTREKLVAAGADRFVVIVDPSKLVCDVRPPIPLELLSYGLASTLRRLRSIGPVERRDAPLSPDGGVICDLVDVGAIGDPGVLASALAEVPGVVEHGLFPPELVHDVVVGRDGFAEWLRVSPAHARGPAHPQGHRHA